MEKLLSVHEKKGTKQARTKKTKPVKIVYISNPMKVKTTASEFRALVQELTGRDSGMPDPTKYLEIDGSEEIIAGEDHDDAVFEVPIAEPAACEVPMKRSESHEVAFEPYDDVFVPQVFENFTGFFPSNLLCGSRSSC
ncbi:hypothetical protein RHMOL_Rhmol04G0154600 [Rhododendron molle]|uniref:Uncharacterized protein n=1 Tax=Rhododendron molle TaxID=49168 RepID=A0ACC0P1V7_RHOML|nr:hypothetical protein RHMOL_Rhmol04G0154600 [Rhododendron molle]